MGTEQGKLSIPAVLILIFSIIAGVGCVMPWFKILIVQKSGVQTDGFFAFLGAVFALIFSLIGVVRVFSRGLALLCMLAGMIMCAVPVYMLAHLKNAIKVKALVQHVLQPGFYVCLTSGSIIFIVALFATILGPPRHQKKKRLVAQSVERPQDDSVGFDGWGF